MREYQFETTARSSRTNSECFNEDDIINIYPIIKQVPPKVQILLKRKSPTINFLL